MEILFDGPPPFVSVPIPTLKRGDRPAENETLRTVWCALSRSRQAKTPSASWTGDSIDTMLQRERLSTEAKFS